jgi:hypothetical protein
VAADVPARVRSGPHPVGDRSHEVHRNGRSLEHGFGDLCPEHEAVAECRPAEARSMDLYTHRVEVFPGPPNAERGADLVSRHARLISQGSHYAGSLISSTSGERRAWRPQGRGRSRGRRRP